MNTRLSARVQFANDVMIDQQQTVDLDVICHSMCLVGYHQQTVKSAGAGLHSV
jgi:hypothetical protein